MANEKGNIDTKHTKSSSLQLKYCEIKGEDKNKKDYRKC